MQLFFGVVCCCSHGKTCARIAADASAVAGAVGCRSKQHQVAGGTVGAKQLARHLDLTHPRIAQLADEEHVLERLPNGRFNLDDSRVRYIRWLRDPERRSAKSKVDQEFTQAKAELIRIRIAEKQKVLMLTDEAMEVGEKLIGTMLTAMGGMAPRVARCAGNSVAVRREVDAIVYETVCLLPTSSTSLPRKRLGSHL